MDVDPATEPVLSVWKVAAELGVGSELLVGLARGIGIEVIRDDDRYRTRLIRSEDLPALVAALAAHQHRQRPYRRCPPS